MPDSFSPCSLKSLTLSWLLISVGCTFSIYRFGSLSLALSTVPPSPALSLSLSISFWGTLYHNDPRLHYKVYSLSILLCWISDLTPTILASDFDLATMRSLQSLVCWYIYLMYFLLYDVFTYVLSNPRWS